ncbi:putative nucleotide-diphospho-sugar transferase [Pseudomonas helleri]|uniref:Nucleotide-diphospho-sugar transferase domain-containing protein n=1 Tax=Pseudomonas helleri TaxID=1608996 RepID=A0A6A7Z4W1_9PSED|nr:putative nucleotide-diphospho-sugar transferase [Pseudomonas helleri]MQT25075.1 hypothetical protein [Pseudomonas helleri]MQT82716.1 hypothetical protein [Pseudomonas helleri]MQU15798.1 hypothetical protein [Pseudomonas helleri]MQU25396.1 hypothetical protein [Pseudomonas helleri]
MNPLSKEANAKCAIFTVCNIAYLPKALVLASSLKKFGAPKLIIYLFDKLTVEVDSAQYESVADIRWIEDVGLKDFETYAFKYDITEFSTSLKPWLTLKLLEHNEKVVFLDPDICMFSSIDPILEVLDKQDIVLTPHYITPNESSDVGMMRFGSYNLGFYAIRKTNESVRFLQWWSERCLNLCYFETQFGLSTDQKWISIAPCFFPSLYTSFDLGWNVAFWNLHERKISKKNDNFIINDKFPLIFFHFSSFDESKPELLSKRPFADQQLLRQDFIPLVNIYKEALDDFKTQVPSVPYTYDVMSNGDYISPTLRRAYASVMNDFIDGHDPFDSAGPVAAFAKKNFLLRKSSSYKSSGFSDLESNRSKLKVINSLMKLALLLVGPNRFMNLSRLLVFLSSFRLNRDLWKL